MSKTRFIIQKHDASRLHYDFRLEVDGVLYSWAVPKGVSTDPSEKRLAIEVDDHAMAAYDFEGVIAEEDYGGGVVMIWERGTYENISKNKDHEPVDMKSARKNGHIAVKLHGEKIQGGYALTRFRENEDQPQWLLVKMDDDQADARRNPVSTEPDSVVSDRSIDDIEEEEDPVKSDEVGC